MFLQVKIPRGRMWRFTLPISMLSRPPNSFASHASLVNGLHSYEHIFLKLSPHEKARCEKDSGSRAIRSQCVLVLDSHCKAYNCHYHQKNGCYGCVPVATWCFLFCITPKKHVIIHVNAFLCLTQAIVKRHLITHSHSSIRRMFRGGISQAMPSWFSSYPSRWHIWKAITLELFGAVHWKVQSQAWALSKMCAPFCLGVSYCTAIFSSSEWCLPMSRQSAKRVVWLHFHTCMLVCRWSWTSLTHCICCTARAEKLFMWNILLHRNGSRLVFLTCKTNSYTKCWAGFCSNTILTGTSLNNSENRSIIICRYLFCAGFDQFSQQVNAPSWDSCVSWTFYCHLVPFHTHLLQPLTLT